MINPIQQSNSLYILKISLILCLMVSCKKNEIPTSVEPTKTIFNEASTARIDSTLKDFVDQGKIAGVSALVYEKGKEVYFNAFGYANKEDSIPMERNTIVQIYSMTKPITGTALMQLFEQGKFELDDPVAKYLPEFANIRVYTGVDNKGNIVTETPARPMTIRDLTRHTAGFYNGGDIEPLNRLLQQADLGNFENTLTAMAKKMGEIPLFFHPGEQWEYGPSVDVQALLVERLSGQSFESYLRDHVLDPLGMHETRYVVPDEDRSRFSAVYRRGENGVLTQLPDDELHAYNYKDWPLKHGGWGLTSTVDDYMHFAQMLVNKGVHGNDTILKSKTVALMATNQLADSITKRIWLPSKGQVGFGINFAVRLRPPADASENYGVVGEFFWDGAASTLFWVDPENEITAVLFVQLFPFDGIGLHKSFRDAVYGKHNVNK